MILDLRTISAALLVLAPWLALTVRDGSALDRHEAQREAVDGIAGIAAALTSYFHGPHWGSSPRCPAAQAGPTPPLDLRCELGPRRRCRPRASPRGAAEYLPAVWHEDPIWRALAFELREPHRFHYTLRAWSEGDACDFLIGAEADLDGDGRRTNIEARGRLNDLEIRLDPIWRIDQVSD